MNIIKRPYLFPNELGYNSWWDANNLDKAGNILTSGGAITSLSDFGANANTVTQSTGTNQPTYALNDGNGNNAIALNNNQYLSIASSASNNAIGATVIFFVGKLSGASAGSSYIFLSKYNGWYAGMFNRRALFTQGGVLDYLTTSQVITLNTPFSYLLRYYNNAGTWTADFYINETFIQSVTGGSPQAANTNPLYVGGWRGDTVQNWQGSMRTMGIKWGTIDDWSLQQTLRFLKFRRGS